MTSYTFKPGYVDEVTMDDFGPVGDFDAAEIVDADGRVFVVVKEPAARTEHGQGFDDTAFRQAVRAMAVEVVGPDSEFNGVLPVSLVFDPARDNTEEEVIREA